MNEFKPEIWTYCKRHNWFYPPDGKCWMCDFFSDPDSWMGEIQPCL